jgi:hypothetical protein
MAFICREERTKEPARGETMRDNQMNREDTVPSEYTEAEMKLCILSEPGLWIRIHFLRIRIRTQSLMVEANTDLDPDPDPIRIQGFNDQKLKKNYS